MDKTVTVLIIMNALTLLFGVVEAAAWVANVLTDGSLWTTVGLIALLGVIVAVVMASMPDIDIDIDIDTEE